MGSLCVFLNHDFSKIFKIIKIILRPLRKSLRLCVEKKLYNSAETRHATSLHITP